MDDRNADALQPGMTVVTADGSELGKVKNVWTPAGETRGPDEDQVQEPATGNTFPPSILDTAQAGTGAAQVGNTIVGPSSIAEPESVAGTAATAGSGTGQAVPVVNAPTQTYFQIDRRLAPDWYVPSDAVAEAGDDRVTLSLTKDQCDDQDWGVKPDWLAE